MRVISGRLKGQTLLAPKGRKIRPTSDHVKETLFNMMGQEILHCRFLDVFAGTGNIGIEALSRGAEQVVFIEKQSAHVQVLKRNLTNCGVEGKSTVYCGDANKILLLLKKKACCFDVIFLDPPYYQTKMLRDIFKKIVELSLLAETGLVVVEHASTFMPEVLILHKLELSKSRRIGDTTLSFYRPVVNA